MTGPAIPTIPAKPVSGRPADGRPLINPVTGYGLAIVISAAFWASLLFVIF